MTGMAGIRSGRPCGTSGTGSSGRFIVGSFVGIAHEINNALTGISGFADPLRMRLGKEPKLQASLARRLREVPDKV
jgi:nitrogen-specific signal transduction histidine kinase